MSHNIGFRQGAWHFCQRCDTQHYLSQLTWQRGLLLCSECLDTGVNPLIGDREREIARILSEPTNELKPDDKLTDPGIANSLDEDISF